MTSTLRKNLRRTITGSLGRYLAILLIITLGVAFFTGLKLTRPAMVGTATAFVEDTRMYDLRVLSTIGFEDADVQVALQTKDVTAAAGSVQQDVLWEHNDELKILRTHMLTEGVNEVELNAGRMPEAANEVLADAELFDESWLGQTLTLSPENDQDTLDTFSGEEYTIVGLCHSPLYLAVDRGTSSLGSGTVYAFLLLTPEGYDTEYYTELYIKTEDYTLYAQEYDDHIDTLTNSLEATLTASAQSRMDDLIAEARQEIDDGQAELDEQRADAQAELDDAKAQLEDALLELQDGEAELEEAKTQLDDAKAQLDDAAEQLSPGFTSWEQALQAGEEALADGRSQLDSGLAQGQKALDDSAAQLAEGRAAYEEGYSQWAEGQAAYEEGLAQWQAGWDQYSAAAAQLAEGRAAYEEGNAQYQESLALYQALQGQLSEAEAAAMEAQLTQTAQILAASLAEIEAGEAELAAQEPALTASRQTLDDSKAQLDEAKTQLDASRSTLDSGWAQWRSGRAQLESQRAAGEAELAEGEEQLDQFREGIQSYYDGVTEYEDGLRSLEDGRAEYNDGLAEYEEGLAEFETEIADAEAELEDARQELAELEDPTLYLLNREESNGGYATFKNDSLIVDRLSTIFPLFFFLIAALVCSTTMTRMVDDDRTQIGTLRALGYSRGSIMAKYLIYSGSSATLGCLIGYFGGGYLFPLVIWIAYKMLYKIPGFVCVYSPSLLLLSLAASLLCSAGVTALALRRTMRSTPADLIRPLTPAAGKRILLERITPLWSRLKFLHKVSLRNIFRFKKRMFMMLLGIAGCTALVLTGFGIWDSVGDIGNYQFDDIDKYDLTLTLDRTVEADWLADLEADFGDRIAVDASALIGSGDCTGPGSTQTVFFVATDDPDLTQLISLHQNGVDIPYPEDGQVVLTEKLATMAGVKVGDTVTLSMGDTQRGTAVVAALTENYVYNYVYMSAATYEAALGKDYQPETVLLSTYEDTDDYALGAELSNLDHVASVTVIANTRQSIDDMMKSLNYVVMLVLASAAALAFIVLFNLGNINISERGREIATIKVLGFHRGESGSYVFRENLLLTLMGIVCGLPLGVALHRFVMSQIVVDMVNFKSVINPLSFLLSVLLVLLFSIITDLILRKKIYDIDMAQSLKSIE